MGWIDEADLWAAAVVSGACWRVSHCSAECDVAVELRSWHLRLGKDMGTIPEEGGLPPKENCLVCLLIALSVLAM